MNDKTVTKILPENATQATHGLIKLSHALLNLADRETQALVQDDFVTFSILQDEKELLAERYMNASVEFRARIEEFRSVDRSLLDKMEEIQKELAEKTHRNNAIVTKIRNRSEKKTHSTLFTVQEAAQQKQVRFENVQEGRT